MKEFRRYSIMIGIFGLLGATTSAIAQQPVINGPVTTLTLPNQANQAGGGIDFVHAIPMPLPLTSRAPALPEQSRNAPPLNQIFGPPRGSEGGSGDGKQSPVLLFPPKQVPQNTPAPNGGPPPEFGTSGQPYTTSEATAFLDDTYAHYPFRAAGQLTFKKPNVPGTARHR